MRLSSILKTISATLMVGYAFMVVSCSDHNAYRRSADADSGRQLYQWMQTRVELMIRHKANCSDMARALIESHQKATTQLKVWSDRGAGEWLKRQAQLNPKFGQELTRLIAKGDLVYYHCAYQDAFRAQLTENIKAPGLIIPR
jgi:hypothetical protein